MNNKVIKVGSEYVPADNCFGNAIYRSWLALVVCLFITVGCSSIQSTMSERLAKSLSAGITNQSDVEMVKAGIPSYLLMIDGMIVEDPENVGLYFAGAKLYSTLANFVKEDQSRLAFIANQAFHYSKKMLCLTREEWCGLTDQTYDVFRQSIEKVDLDEVDIIYMYGATWASNIEVHRADMSAIANLPKVKAIMHRVLQVDELYDKGGAHLYLGVLESLIPPALGGKPDVAKSHFERVIEINNGRHLMAMVMYAEYHARVLYDRKLHDELLQKVISQNPNEKGLTLVNVVAQQRAKKLLATAEEYF